MNTNETARKIVGDYLMSLYGVPSTSLYDKMKGDELVKAIEKSLADALLEKNGEMKKALETIVRMDAVTEEERAHYWSDRAERMRDLAMMALGGEVTPLSELLGTARRGLSYVQHRATDLEDARRAAAHALAYLPSAEGVFGKHLPPSPICQCGEEADKHGGCRNYRPLEKCKSSYKDGQFFCEKDESHLNRKGDVEHRSGGTTWLSI